MSRLERLKRRMDGRDESGASIIELVIAVPIFIMLTAALIDGAMMIVTKMQANDGATAAAREAMAEAGTDAGLDEDKIKAAALSAMPGISSDQVTITVATSDNDEDFYYHLPKNAELPSGATITETGLAYNGEELALEATKTGQRVAVGVSVSRPWITAIGQWIYAAADGSGSGGSGDGTYSGEGYVVLHPDDSWYEFKEGMDDFGFAITGDAEKDARQYWSAVKSSLLLREYMANESFKAQLEEEGLLAEEGDFNDVESMKKACTLATGKEFSDWDTAFEDLKEVLIDYLARTEGVPSDSEGDSSTETKRWAYSEEETREMLATWLAEEKAEYDSASDEAAKKALITEDVMKFYKLLSGKDWPTYTNQVDVEALRASLSELDFSESDSYIDGPFIEGYEDSNAVLFNNTWPLAIMGVYLDAYYDANIVGSSPADYDAIYKAYDDMATLLYSEGGGEKIIAAYETATGSKYTTAAAALENLSALKEDTNQIRLWGGYMFVGCMVEGASEKYRLTGSALTGAIFNGLSFDEVSDICELSTGNRVESSKEAWDEYVSYLGPAVLIYVGAGNDSRWDLSGIDTNDDYYQQCYKTITGKDWPYDPDVATDELIAALCAAPEDDAVAYWRAVIENFEAEMDDNYADTVEELKADYQAWGVTPGGSGSGGSSSGWTPSESYTICQGAVVAADAGLE